MIPYVNLPDLLPRLEPRLSSSPSKDKSVTKSDSSSDISIISNPSEASIEVITLIVVHYDNELDCKLMLDLKYLTSFLSVPNLHLTDYPVAITCLNI